MPRAIDFDEDGQYWDAVWEERQDAFYEKLAEVEHARGECESDCSLCAAEREEEDV